MISKFEGKPTSCPDNPLGILWDEFLPPAPEPEEVGESSRNLNRLPRIQEADSGPWVLPPEYRHRLTPLRN